MRYIKIRLVFITEQKLSSAVLFSNHQQKVFIRKQDLYESNYPNIDVSFYTCREEETILTIIASADVNLLASIHDHTSYQFLDCGSVV